MVCESSCEVTNVEKANLRGSGVCRRESTVYRKQGRLAGSRQGRKVEVGVGGGYVARADGTSATYGEWRRLAAGVLLITRMK